MPALLLALCALLSLGGAPPAVPDPAAALPLVFVENRGQLPEGVAFQTRVPGLSVQVRKDGWSVRTTDGEELRLCFADAAPGARVEGMGEPCAAANYLRGADRAGWVVGAPAFERVRIRGVRPGVDVELFEREGRLEYELHLKAGTPVDTVAFSLDGAERVSVDGRGSLVAHLGERRLRQRAPRGFQTLPDGSRRELPGAFRRLASGEWSIVVEGRDLSLPLVIDPVFLYREFVGGSSADEARAVAIGPDGALYVAGWSRSSDFPLVGRAHQGHDAVVFKLDPVARELVWASYVGGGSDDEALAIAIGSKGEVIVAGETRSSDLPTSEGAHAEEKAGGRDAFVIALGADGSSLLWASYLGGGADERVGKLALAPDGTVYVTGSTRSEDFPVRPGAFQEERRGGRDAFVARLDGDGRVLLAATFLGGVRDDEGRGIAVDSKGRVYVAGRTDSGDFPTSPGALEVRKSDVDAFVAKLGSGLGELHWSSFLGGSGSDEANAIAVGADEEPWVAGWTESADFPLSLDALVSERPGRRDAFVARLSASGGNLGYGSYVGGEGSDELFGIALDAHGVVWAAGSSSSDDLRVTPDAVQERREGGRDAVLVAIDPARGSLVFGSYLGGPGDDAAFDVAADSATRIVALAGMAQEVRPSERGTWSSQKRGPGDALVARFEPGLCGAAAERTVLGTGCGAELAAELPRLGQPFELRVHGAPPQSSGYLLASLPTVSSELVEGICELHVERGSARVVETLRTDDEGEWRRRVRLPRSVGLCGRTLLLQAVVNDRDVGPLSFGQLTQGVLLSFGD